MKKLTKKVVVATTAGLACMIFAAACAYGTESLVTVEERTSEAATFESTEDASEAASAATSIEEQELINDSDLMIPETTAYGPEGGNW